jgi:hypothetical protein
MLIDTNRNPDRLRKYERLALLGYTQGDFEPLNPKLWRQGPGSGIRFDRLERAKLTLIDRALAKIPCFVGTVYRGAKIHGSRRPGQVYTAKA